MTKMEWYGDDVIRSVKNSLPLAIKKACIIVEGSAKPLCPVDTGNLRDSITHTAGEDQGRVGTNVEYAPYVELGTRKMAAQPYLRPAADKNRARVAKELGVIIGHAAEVGGR